MADTTKTASSAQAMPISIRSWRAIWSRPTTSWPRTASSTPSATSACAIRAIPTAICRCRRWRRATWRSADIITFDLDSKPIDANGRPPYRERFIHGQIYKARPDVNAVVHSHSPTIIPFSVTEKPLRAIFHNGHFLGQGVPVWEIREHAGVQNNMLVLTNELGQSLAQALGKGSVVLMRGHGNAVAGLDLKTAVFRAIYTEVNAKLQMQAVMLGGPINFLNEYEAAQGAERRPPLGDVEEAGRSAVTGRSTIMSRIRWHCATTFATSRRALAFAANAKAETVADFYRGKTVRMVIGYGAGGNYDLYGRLATEFLGRHIPGNPTIIPVNMPGAGGFKAVDYLYKVAPKDGTHLGAVAQQLAMTLLVDDKMGIDPRRFSYLGRLTSMVDVAVALPKSGLTSFEDARKREVTVGAGQSTSTSAIYARALNAYAGSRFKIVTGYSGTAEIQLAAERGEVDVNGGKSLPAIIVQYPEWLQGKAVLLYQNGLKRYSHVAAGADHERAGDQRRGTHGDERARRHRRDRPLDPDPAWRAGGAGGCVAGGVCRRCSRIRNSLPRPKSAS